MPLGRLARRDLEISSASSTVFADRSREAENDAQMPQSGHRKNPEKQVYLLGADAALLKDLARHAESGSVALSRFRDAAGLVDACREFTPDAIMLDISLIPTREGLAGFLQRLTPDGRETPALICIGDEQGIDWRLEAYRCGARACLARTAAVEDLAGRLIGIVKPAGGRRRILIVEDDVNQSRVYAKALVDSGMAVRALSDPPRIFETLETFHPELILMDLYMPGVNGAELTRLIRDHDRFWDIPIIFLSAEDDPERQLEALRVGADSFIVKPARRSELIGAIEHRIWMHQWLKDRWAVDWRLEAASGLIRKRELLAQVDRLMRDRDVDHDQWGLLLIDLDKPQRLLRVLGISETERLLQGLGPLIARHLERDEIVARVGDFRYALLARRGAHDRLRGVAKKIAARIGKTEVDTDDGPMRVSVSMGTAPFSPPASDAVTMISRAHKAAKVASRTGGNRIADWVPELTADEESAERTILPLVYGALSSGIGSFELYFQPILSLRHRHGALYECLLRMRSADSELISPSDLLRVAGKHGKGDSLDRWVLNHAMDLLESRRERRRPLRLLVHQHFDSIAGLDWRRSFLREITERDLVKVRPSIVLQAHELVARLAVADGLLPELQRMGIEVCATNVNGSPEELAMLEQLGIKLVKMPFNRIVRAGTEDLDALVAGLRKRGISVIAGGIEDADTMTLAWRVRPDYVQGNYLKMPSAELGYDLELDIGRIP